MISPSQPEAKVLYVVPLTLAQANDMVSRWHRHHVKVISHRFSLGLVDDEGASRGAAIVGRPVARGVDPYLVAEVTRLVTDGSKNACSMLYGAAARCAQAMGFERIQTYILQSEPGTSLKASGWTLDKLVSGGSWSTPSRLRDDKHPTEPKSRWSKTLNGPRPVREVIFAQR